MGTLQRSRLVAVGVLVVLAVAAVALSRDTLASGHGDRGSWRLTASWTPWQSCVRMTEASSEGGACGFARPATLNEAHPFLADDGGAVVTLVAGPVPAGTARIEVTAVDGESVAARMVRAGLDRYFVARFAGRRSVAGITAFDADGNVVDRLDHAPIPPPSFPDGSSA